MVNGHRYNTLSDYYVLETRNISLWAIMYLLIAMSFPSNQTNTISLFIDAQTNLRKHFAIFVVTALEEVAKLIDRIVGLDF